MEFIAEKFGDAWLASLKAILDSGDWIQSERGQKTIELRNVLLVALEPFKSKVDPIVQTKTTLI